MTLRIRGSRAAIAHRAVANLDANDCIALHHGAQQFGCSICLDRPILWRLNAADLDAVACTFITQIKGIAVLNGGQGPC